MGREIRRVPEGWEHPRDEEGNYLPMLDQTYEEAIAEWTEGRKAWLDGSHPDLAEYGSDSTWEEWSGNAPTPEYHRPAFDAEPTHYQIYQTVSEGTPTSPVFASLGEMEAWLVGEGFSEVAASRFVKNGWAPSMIMVPGHGVSGIGIHSLDFPPEQK